MDPCPHVELVQDVSPAGPGCDDCTPIGATWLHLRMCMICGHVGCCDSSPNRHATAHFHANPEHPLVRSYEPGEDWWWCYQDEVGFMVKDAPPPPRIPET